MAARCTICGHAKRAEAEAAIAAGQSVRSVAQRFSLSYQSLDRHQRKCARQAIQTAAAARDMAFADSLMTEVELLHRTTMDLLRESREGKWLELPSPTEAEPNAVRKVYDVPSVKNAIRAIAEARKNLALIARLTGQLEPKAEEQRTITFEEFEVMYLSAKRRV